MSVKTLIDTSLSSVHTFKTNLIDCINNGWDEYLKEEDILIHLKPLPLPKIINTVNILLSDGILSFSASLYLIKSYCLCSWYEDFTVLDTKSKSNCTELVISKTNSEPHLIVHTQDLYIDERVTLTPAVVYFKDNKWHFKYL